MAAGSAGRSAATPRRLGVARALIEGRLLEGDVEIVDERITDAGLSPPGTGMAIPGLVDIQVNGYAGVDVAGTAADGLPRIAQALAADGVLTFCPTVITAPGDEMVNAVRTIAEARLSEPGDGAHIAGAHVEGPFLAPRRAGVHPRDLLREPDRDLVDRLLAAGPIAIYSLAPELPGALPLIADLAERGVVVSAAHSDATAAQAVEAFTAGVRSTTHTWNGMRPLRHRDPGIVGAALADSRVHIGLIGDGVHVSREVLAITWRAAADRICLVTDAVAAARAPDGRYRIGDVVIERRDGRVLDLEGRVGGGTTPLLEAVRMAVDAGIPIERAVAAASSVPATLLGLPGAGVLRSGGRADVLVVSDELELQAVLIGGREIAHAGS